ncbi:sodium/mannose cotransporter SLC5A10-like isoform X2 [Clavelina lepadiformis]|uniref:sodium/mannose cotransporter SLC5A10-like isoform X2 n=1 Tax=Clavelina lepadiformis TaxID=159417 RepID=UPI004043015A
MVSCVRAAGIGLALSSNLSSQQGLYDARVFAQKVRWFSASCYAFHNIACNLCTNQNCSGLIFWGVIHQIGLQCKRISCNSDSSDRDSGLHDVGWIESSYIYGHIADIRDDSWWHHGYMKVGSWENFVSLYMASIPQSTVDILVTGNNTTCGVPGADSFHMLRDPATSDLPWTGIMTGMFCFGSYYFCCDQVIVQRALAAKNLQHAKIGCVFAGFLKIIPMYMMVMTGMTSRILFPDEVACADPKECKRICGNEQGCWNIAYPKLLLEVLPTGLRGIVIAAMLSALMSSLTSIFNSASTIFTLDIWKRIRTNCSEREMLIVGKLTVLVLVVISILWVPIVSSVGGQLWTYLNAVLSALGSPIFVIYFLGILFPRVNEKGAFWGLMIGLAVGATRLGLDFFYKVPLCGEEDTRPAIIAKINYLHVSPIVFFLSAAIAIVVSFLTDPPSPELLINTTWFTLHNDKEAAFTKGTGTIRDEEGRSQSNPLNQKTGTTAKFRKYDLRNCFLNASAIMLSLTIAFLVGYHA